MTVIWFSPARIVWSLFFAVNALAIGLGAFCPSASPDRRASETRIVSLDSVHRSGLENRLHFFDVANEQKQTLKLPKRESVDCLAISHWEDEESGRYLVGRWRQWDGDGPERCVNRTGLARLSWPDGKIVTRIDSEIMPTSPPCWFPGTEAKVLFASGDGRLYSLDWDASSPEIVRLELPPELDRSFIREVVWPENRILGGLALATVYAPLATDGKRLDDSRIWWLRLTPDGNRVAAAGPIFRDGGAESLQGTSDRWPEAVLRPDGSRALLYQSQSATRIDCELRMAPLTMEKIPRADRSQSVSVVGSCCPNPVGSTPDGRWATAMTVGGLDPQAMRVAVPSHLPLPSMIGNVDPSRLFARIPTLIDRIGSLTLREVKPRVHL